MDVIVFHLSLTLSLLRRYEESYQIELQYFLDLVEGVAQQEILQEDVLTVTRIASACEKSAKEGVIVTLDW